MATTLTAASLLAAWESAGAQAPLRRAVTLLSAVWPERNQAEWSACPVGERDTYLFHLRDAWFGPALETVARCPNCQETVEANFRTSDVVAGVPATPAFEIVAGGHPIRVRLPTTDDMLEVARVPLEEAREKLLERCIDGARDLPAEALDAAIKAMAQADPQADVQIALECPSCGHAWSWSFDIRHHLWADMEDWALRLLEDVHRLALAYGWSERDILGMSARRRRIYLDLLEAHSS